MVTPELTEQRHYDPATGDYDGQLVHADLVDQLPAPTERKPGGPMERDEWRRSNAARVGHAAYKLLDTLTGYSNPDGRCWPGMDLLAEVTGMSERTLRRGLAELRRKELVWPTFPGFTVSRANPYQLAGGLDGWGCDKSGTTVVTKVAQPVVTKVAHRTPSSSNPKINPQSLPGLTDAKRVEDPRPETETRTGLKSFSFEEERTGTGSADYQAWVDRHLSEVPTDSEIEPLAKHCWSEWGPHWGGGWAAAWPTWTKGIAGRKKFRKDVVAQLQKVGLPKPLPPDPENDLARERAAAWLDQRLEEAPKRMVDVLCAGCKMKRQLPPGETHCHPCRKDLVEVTA